VAGFGRFRCEERSVSLSLILFLPHRRVNITITRLALCRQATREAVTGKDQEKDQEQDRTGTRTARLKLRRRVTRGVTEEYQENQEDKNDGCGVITGCLCQLQCRLRSSLCVSQSVQPPRSVHSQRRRHLPVLPWLLWRGLLLQAVSFRKCVV
jgi:hypothetical protein